MCGRFTLRTSARKIADAFGLATLPQWEPSFNIAPTQPVLAVRKSDAGAPREGVLLRWGLVPGWAKDLGFGARTINARAETVSEKPAFRAAFKCRRCLIVADGFFEWRRDGAQKQPLFIHRADDAPFAFAGLWEQWQRESQLVESCAIVTTDANQQLRSIHERMPVILPSDDYDTWLDPTAKSDRLAALLSPYPGMDLAFYKISSYVNRPANNDPRCIEPIH